MIKLYDSATNREIGTLTEPQLEFMMEQLEEESEEDQDYYINGATIDLIESAGADAALVAPLRSGLGDREEMDVRWSRE